MPKNAFVSESTCQVKNLIAHGEGGAVLSAVILEYAVRVRPETDLSPTTYTDIQTQ